MEYKKQCEICGNEFIAKSAKGRYCSQKCRQTAGRRGLSRQNTKSQKISDDQLIEACKIMTLNEIAKKYGMHPYSLPRRFYRLGCKPVGYIEGKDYSERLRILNERIRKGEVPLSSGTFHSTYGECWHYVDGHDEIVKRKQPGFFYLESRTSGKKPKQIRLQCKECGEVIERANSTVRYQKCECDNCKAIKQAKKELLNERVKLMRFFNAFIESKTPKRCIECGKEFYSQYANVQYCSQKCKKKKGSGKGYRRRARKYGVFYDPSVTRVKIIARDKCTCQICGEKCDPNDLSWGTSGPLYPTLDHIIPLAKGGPHTWDNCQCAHAICNSEKRDLITA